MPAPPASAAAPSAEDAGSVDKTIVDRRASHRATASRVALRDARREMQSSDHEPPRFRDELLQIHAERLLGSRWALVALAVVLVGTIGLLLNPLGRMLAGGWLAAAIALAFVGALLAGRFRQAVTDGRPLAGWTSRFGAVQIAHGALWAAFLILGHPLFVSGWTAEAFASPGLPGPLLIGVLLVVGSTHLLISHALVGGVAWVCGPPTICILALLIRPMLTGDGAAAGSLVGAAVLAVTFSLLGNRLLHYARNNVRARVEKDHAILEAEEARNLSEEARRRAEEANMAKTRFLATMSHELRTPLNAILGFSEIMQAQALGPLGNEKYAEYAEDIHTSGSHLLKLINEILDLSRVEAGRYELNEEPVDLAAVATDAMQMVKLKASQKSLKLQIRAERALPRVWADERAVRQVVLNLLTNAVKFTPKGGGVTVKVGWTGGGGQYVTVTDTGPGIAEEEIPVVLSAFGQGSVALRSAEPGSGLGLPIVQAFMKIHDGRLDLNSRLREGTSVTAIFPRKRVMTGETVARAA